MKGAPGLLLAVGLGVIAAFCNWFYLAQQARKLERVDFVGVAEQTKINPGDRIEKAQLQKIAIPANAVGSLQVTAVPWSAVDTVVGMPASKSYSAGEIVLWQDLKTPSVSDLLDTLGPNDAAIGVPIDTRTVVVQNLNPGAWVSFVNPRYGQAAVPTPAGSGAQGGATEDPFIGRFEILAMGTRKGQTNLLAAQGAAAAQETTMTVRVKTEEGAPEEKWRKLMEVLRATNNQPLSVLLHGKAEAEGGRGKARQQP
jgi:hypothetical protein